MPWPRCGTAVLVPTYGLYRAAYAVITNSYFGHDGLDGHYAWCVRMLRRPDVAAALVG